jgi:hypothetical protein
VGRELLKNIHVGDKERNENTYHYDGYDRKRL